MELQDFTDADFSVDPSAVKFGKELGRGNFSRVYKGEFEAQPVAVKKQVIVDPDLERYLLIELAILRAVKHENVIQFYGAYREEENVANIITEYVEGGDLRRLLQDKATPVGWKLRAQISHGCARGIHYLHESGLIHRDIKTENVLLDAACTPKICDFGFARKAAPEGQTMTMCGTDEFMAPEIIFGMEYGLAADVYSFGIMLGETMTRRIPGSVEGFLDRQPRDGFGVNMEELEAECNKVSAPASLHLLSAECVATEAADRPTAEAVMDWLQDLLSEMSEDAEPRPDLSSEHVLATLDAYIHKQSVVDGEEDEGGSEIYGGSSKPTTEEAKRRVESALHERDEALMRAEGADPGAAGSITASVRDSVGGVSDGGDGDEDGAADAGRGAAASSAAGARDRGASKTVEVDIDEHKTSSSRSGGGGGGGKRASSKTGGGGGGGGGSSAGGGAASGGAVAKQRGNSTLRAFLCLKPKEKVGAAADAAMPEWERMVGWVVKRGGRIKTWKRRYMVITLMGIVYFKSPEDQAKMEPQGSIEFSQMTEIAGVVCNALPTVMTGKPNSFGIHTMKRTYYVGAGSAQERDAWIKAICDGYAAFTSGTKKKKKKKKKKKPADGDKASSKN